MKFSIVVPVYNVEKYIINCLESINKQSYKNFEVIIVNDGSPDNSEKLIKNYIKDKKQFKYYKKENGGLSDARNYGIKFVTGDYLLFLDSDDTIKKDLLLKLNNILDKKEYDLIKFNFIDLENNKETKHEEKIKKSKEVKIADIINFDYFEPACSYCYRTYFYKLNNFKFEIEKYHEDFGLIPLILTRASNIYYLNYYGYVYLKRENSIVNDNTKNTKKANDVLYFTLKNIKILKEDNNILDNNKKLLINFYANAAIHKLKTIKNKKNYIKIIREQKLYKYLLEITSKQKIKKTICKISYSLYAKLFL